MLVNAKFWKNARYAYVYPFSNVSQSLAQPFVTAQYIACLEARPGIESDSTKQGDQV